MAEKIIKITIDKNGNIDGDFTKSGMTEEELLELERELATVVGGGPEALNLEKHVEGAHEHVHRHATGHTHRHAGRG